jgi:hypothetical protein
MKQHRSTALPSFVVLGCGGLLQLLAPHAGAVDAPVLNPDGASTYGVTVPGDYPPPACWPTFSGDRVRLRGPVYEGAVHLFPAYAWSSVAHEVLLTSGIIETLSPPIAGIEQVTTPFAVGVPNLTMWPVGNLGFYSNNLEIEPLPAAGEVLPPVVAHTITPGSRAVGVAGVFPGATVTITAPGGFTATRRNDDGTHISVPLPVGLTAGQVISVAQTVGGQSASTFTTVGGSAQNPLAPVFPYPVESNATAVVVSGLVPGSFVEVLDTNANLLGDALCGESICVVAVCPATGQLYARATRNGVMVNGFVVDRVGARPNVGTISTVTGSVAGSIQTYNFVEYRPATATAEAVVFVMHGDPGANLGTPYLGYDWLGQAANRMRSVVVSMTVSPADIDPIVGRNDMYIDFVDSWTAIPGNAFSDLPVFFAGHSFGGHSARFAADHFKQTGSKNVRGFIGLAPNSSHLPTHPEIPALVLMGSNDELHWNGSINSGGIYATQYSDDGLLTVVPGPGHYAWNTQWTPNGWPTLSAEREQETGRLAILRFVHDHLPGRGRQDWWVHAAAALTQQRGASQVRMRHLSRDQGAAVIHEVSPGSISPNSVGGTVTSIGSGSVAAVNLPMGNSGLMTMLDVQWTGAFEVRETLSPGSWRNFSAFSGLSLIYKVEPESVPFIPRDFRIRLRDGDGTEVLLWAGACGEIDDALGSPGRFPWIGETLLCPMSAFSALSTNLNMNDIRRLDLVFSEDIPGRLRLGRIELRSW